MTSSHLSNVEYENLKEIYRKFTRETYSFIDIDIT